MIDSFDHGVAGRPAKGLAPVPDDGKQSGNRQRRFQQRESRKLGLHAGGAPRSRSRRAGRPALLRGRRSGLVHRHFADGLWQGCALGAERRRSRPAKARSPTCCSTSRAGFISPSAAHQRASYDYSLFAEPEKSAVARYGREQPDNPATESVWVAEPESYAIGLPPEHNHAEGGIALGYAHDETGALRYGACGEMLWSTGHRLRQSTVAEGGEGEGEADVHGLQGNAVSLVRPQNVPPQQSYFADYDSFFGDAAKAGHIGRCGDLAALRRRARFCQRSDLRPIAARHPAPWRLAAGLPAGISRRNMSSRPISSSIKRADPEDLLCHGRTAGCAAIRSASPIPAPTIISARSWCAIGCLPLRPERLMGFAPTPPWTC